MSTKNFFIVGGILLALRILAGRLFGVTFWPFAYYDDALMFRYADLSEHFVDQSLRYIDLLVKDMGFPIFLKFLQVTGIVYTDAISIIYFFGAVMFTLLFSTLTDIRRKEILLIIYVFVLFNPVAFSGTSLRLYRNSALAPFYILVITMMVYLFVIYWKNLELTLKQRICFSVIFGFFFTWTYYMKEDGIWLLMSLAAIIVTCFFHEVFIDTKPLKEKFIHTLILFLPLIMWFSGTVAYKSINEHYFGVYIINNRTEGELGRFLKNVYHIKSAERTGKIWAPADAVMKAFDTSETLKNNVELRENVLHTPWFTNADKPTIFEAPIHGDFLGWVMLSSIYDTKTCLTLADQETYFKKVNQELETAFENGTLEKDDKFYITSSMGGRTFSEILQLKEGIALAYILHLFVTDNPNITEYRIYTDNDKTFEDTVADYKGIIAKAGDFANIDFFAKNEYYKQAYTFSLITFWIYRVLNLVLVSCSFVGIFLAVRKIIHSSVKECSNTLLTVVIVTGTLLLSAVYALAISWFSEFLVVVAALNFYGIGIIPMLIIFEVFGTYLFLNSFKSIRKYWYIEK